MTKPLVVIAALQLVECSGLVLDEFASPRPDRSRRICDPIPVQDPRESGESVQAGFPLASGLSRCLLAPLAGLEPTHTAPEADALSAELQGQDVLEGRLRPRSASGTVPASADGSAITGWE